MNIHNIIYNIMEILNYNQKIYDEFEHNLFFCLERYSFPLFWK